MYLWPGCLLGGEPDWTVEEIPVDCFYLSYGWSNSLKNVVTKEVRGSPGMADRAGTVLQSWEGSTNGTGQDYGGSDCRGPLWLWWC